jgi:hypothetical protein
MPSRLSSGVMPANSTSASMTVMSHLITAAHSAQGRRFASAAAWS